MIKRLSSRLRILAVVAVLSGCTSAVVTSVAPIGDEPVHVEPSEWEGLWVSELRLESDPIYDNAFSVRVLDAAAGVLEYRATDNCAQAGRVVLRKHTHAGGEARFVNARINESLGTGDQAAYFWARYKRIGDTWIIWLPMFDEFGARVDKGEIPGRKKGRDVLIDSLSGDQLDRISVDKEQRLFNYAFNDAATPNPVLFRISALPTGGGQGCPSASDSGEGSGKPAAAGAPKAR